MKSFTVKVRDHIYELSPSFSGSNEGLIKRLATNKEPLYFAKGETIIQQSDKFNGVYLILEGSTRVFRNKKHSEKFVLWLNFPGDLTGFDGFNSDTGYLSTMVATTNVVACFISKDEVEQLLKTEPEFTLSLMRWLCNRINIIENRVGLNSGKNIRQQFLEALRFLEYSGADRSGRLQYSMKELAEMLGTTRNYIYKIVSDLAREEVVMVEKHQLRITDQHKLDLLVNAKAKFQ